MPPKQPLVLARLLTCVALVLASVSSPSCRRRSGQGQRQVVLYCSVDQAVAEPVIAEFEKQSGIKVRARFDTEASKTVGLVTKLAKEAETPAADVFWSSEIFYTIRLAGEGVLASYTGPQTEDWPKPYADGRKRWHGFALRARVIAYNTRRVKAEDAPRHLEDLLESKWRDRIVMASPEFGTTGGDVTSWFVHYGTTAAEEILRGLKANKVHLVDGNSTAVRWVATGQADVCLTDTDDVYAGQRNNWPVAMNYLSLGDAGALTIPNTVALVKGGPNPAEAKELIAFLLSERVEAMLAASDSHNTSVRESVRRRFPKYDIPRHLDVDYERVADELPSAILKAREILR